MIFSQIRQLYNGERSRVRWAKFAPRKRVAFSGRKIRKFFEENKPALGGVLRNIRNKAFIYAYVFFVLVAPFSQTRTVHAPVLPPRVVEAQSDDRVAKLESFLKKYNSSLAPYARQFVASADKYGVDWRLLAAISGNESGFGRVYVQGSYNAYGWGGGYIYFKSWEDGIETINRKIYEDYYKFGKRPLTLEQFGKIYSGQPSWPHWVRKISLWMNQISAHQLALDKCCPSH